MHRNTTARTAGTLFVIATAAGVASAVLLVPESLATPQSVDDAAPSITAGALLVLVMAGAIGLIPAALFPVLRRHGEASALGYVVMRILETVLLLPAAIGPLMLVAIGAGTSVPEPADATSMATVRLLTETAQRWAQPASAIFFCVSVVMLNTLLLRGRLVPRWIAGWAIAAVVPYLVGANLVVFGRVDPSGAVHSLLLAPLAINELVLAGRLLVKGFNAPVASELGVPV